MKINSSIQFKAAFLIIVFSLNTVIGFACAVGMDMGFNTSHHHDEAAMEATMHVHTDGKKHIHHNDNDHHTSNNETDNCCNDQVMKFTQLDKSVPQSIKTISPTFLTAFVSAWYDIDILYTSYFDTSIKYFVRSYHPPIPDIRIAIQSFQI